jgi:hypothetical protein
VSVDSFLPLRLLVLAVEPLWSAAALSTVPFLLFLDFFFDVVVVLPVSWFACANVSGAHSDSASSSNPSFFNISLSFAA